MVYRAGLLWLLIRGVLLYSDDPFQRKLVIVSLSFVTAAALGTGSTWVISPALFVRVYRRIAIGDLYAKSSEWERRVTSESRFGGLVFLAFGLGGLYLLLRLLHAF